jgi:hypothetical protein
MLTPIVRYQGKTRYHAVRTVTGGRVGYEWEEDILLVDLKAAVTGNFRTVPIELSANIHNLFNETKVIGWSSGAQAAMHMQGINYEFAITFRL